MSNPKPPPKAKKTSRKAPAKPAKRAPSRRTAKRGAKTQLFWLGILIRFTLAAGVLLAVWLIWLDAQVRERFDGKKWTLPAAVYARPLSLYPGKQMSKEQLVFELQWNSYRPSAYPNQPGYFYQDEERFVIYRRASRLASGALTAASFEVQLAAGRVQSIKQRGQEIERLQLEPMYIGGIFPAHNEDRELLRLESFPPALVAALVRTEDQYYLEHFGVSLRGIARAMLVNAKAGGVVQGGSTLTQQLVKNFFLTHERSFSRKFQEVFMALLLELHYSKKEILQTYLNEVYLGQAGRRAIHGFGLAARFYFAKPVNELNHSEIATLVGLVKGASFYNPRRHPQRATQRRNVVLEVMAEHRIISPEQYQQALAQPLRVAAQERAGQREYPAFLELVRQQLQHDFKLEDLQNDGLKIFTTFDPWLQRNLEQAASEHLHKLEQRHPELKQQLETAAIITSTQGARVQAMLGGRQAGYFGFNRALHAQRAIGSLAKPVIYLSALESGYWHWGKPLSDAPVAVALARGQQWQPQNYDKRSHGTVPMLEALSQSYNQASVRLGMKVGLKNIVINYARLGLKQELPPYPSILLGAVPLSVYEVAQFYQTIAANGVVQPLTAILAVTDNQGQLLSRYFTQGHQEFGVPVMQLLRYGLEQVADQGTAKSLGLAAGAVAAKTGTSNDQRDAWFMGFDAQHLGVVWVGRDDNQPMPLVGASAALPIWRQSFNAIGIEPLAEIQAVQWAQIKQGEFVEAGCGGERYPVLAAQIPAKLAGCGLWFKHPTEENASPETEAEKPRSWWRRLF